MSAACWQTDPSNAPFQHDMDAWAAISNRTYIWDCEPASLDSHTAEAAKTDHSC